MQGINAVSVGRDPVRSRLDAGTDSDLEGLVWTLAGGYSLLEKHPGALELVGGVRYFGILGLLVGPLALSYFFELISMYRQEYLNNGA